ncbi:CHAD domain-containing protein [Mycobacterium camsae]|uniref:CHAD domain-containing protein n=1 Tax=Mycobacterium gordonae TaxID=1778 RepID=UPI001F11A3B2|nr:CHAD domain-containing protein [Mycobacterium gordonae]
MANQACDTVVDYLSAQLDQVFAGLVGLREGDDPIHDTRVAIRRLRSTLRVFGKVMDAAAVGDLDEELKWFAGLLGEVRDCQVQLRRFTAALDELPDELVLGPVKSRIRNDLRAVELPARNRVGAEMESTRYQALLAVLRDWRVRPPVAAGVSRKDLRKRASRAAHKADRRLAAALEDGSGDMLHRARKSAKRARYAAELRKPVDRRARRVVRHYKQIQTVLGDHQDAVVATEVLRRMAAVAGTTPGENGFTFGLLYAREERIASESRSHLSLLHLHSGA